MAEARKSAKLTKARKEARDRSSAFRVRQQELEDLAESYFVQADELDGIEAELARELQQAHDRAVQKRSGARAAADRVIARMLELDVPRAEIAERLGASQVEIRKAAADTTDVRAAAPPESAKGRSTPKESAPATERSESTLGEQNDPSSGNGGWKAEPAFA